MIAVDTNILIYAYRTEARQHEQAKAALAELASGKGKWGIPSSCIAEFICVVTGSRHLKLRTPLELAFKVVQSWVDSPSFHVLHEQPGVWDLVQTLAQADNSTGPGIYDTRIAAICLQNDVTELWTTDKDFERINLKIRNPLS